MKFFVFLTIFAVIYSVSAAPSSGSSESNSRSASSSEEDAAVGVGEVALDDLLALEEAKSSNSNEERSPRRKRATCDLLSYLGMNHTICAGHCIVKGFKGGYCSSKAICTCRN